MHKYLYICVKYPGNNPDLCLKTALYILFI